MRDVQAGHLGFPIFDPIESVSNSSFQSSLHLQYRTLLGTYPGIAILERINNDHRATALTGQMISAGSHSARYDPNDLAMWWLWRANMVGEAEANSNLEAFLNADKIESVAALLVYCSRFNVLQHSINEVYLTPLESLPDCDVKFESMYGRKGIKPVGAITTSHRLNKTATLGDLQRSGFWLKGQKLQAVALLLNCLPKMVCAPAGFHSICPDHVPFGPFGGGSWVNNPNDFIPIQGSEFDVGAVPDIIALYEGLMRHNDHTQKRLLRSLYRFCQAKTRASELDSCLDLGIALEMLLLSEDNGKKERPDQLTLTFRLHGAWVAGKDPEDRKELAERLSSIYSLRSQIAHSGASRILAKAREDKKDKKAAENLIAANFRAAERIMSAILTEGLPTQQEWKGLIFGEPRKG